MFHLSLSNAALQKLLRSHPVKTLFIYSLLGELLVILFVFFAFLTTAEILLPGFISLRLNLTWYIFFLLAASMLLLALGKAAHITPPQKIPLEKTFLTLSALWSLSVIGMSLFHFPWWSICFILVLLILVSIWAWKLLCLPSAPRP